MCQVKNAAKFVVLAEISRVPANKRRKIANIARALCTRLSAVKYSATNMRSSLTRAVCSAVRKKKEERNGCKSIFSIDVWERRTYCATQWHAFNREEISLNEKG